jgi:hypothetical protein
LLLRDTSLSGSTAARVVSNLMAHWRIWQLTPLNFPVNVSDRKVNVSDEVRDPNWGSWMCLPLKNSFKLQSHMTGLRSWHMV